MTNTAEALSLLVKKGDAPKVLGISRRQFEEKIWPLVSQHYTMGVCKMIERVELLAAWEQYKRGCTGRPQNNEGSQQCQKTKATISTKGVTTSSISSTSGSGFSKRLATARAKKPKSTHS